MNSDDHMQECRANWVAAIHQAVGSTPPPSSVWRGPEAIAAALQPFIRAQNHLFFPTGGGFDLAGVTPGREPGTIEFQVSDRVIYLAKVQSLSLEFIAADPAESFIIMELDKLTPCGVYQGGTERSEEVVEISLLHYVNRGVWDAGYLGYDEDGSEKPLPPTSRIVIRIFDGRLMLVGTGGIWNANTGTYDGRHDQMSNDRIRAALEAAIAANP